MVEQQNQLGENTITVNFILNHFKLTMTLNPSPGHTILAANI